MHCEIGSIGKWKCWVISHNPVRISNTFAITLDHVNFFLSQHYKTKLISLSINFYPNNEQLLSLLTWYMMLMNNY